MAKKCKQVSEVKYNRVQGYPDIKGANPGRKFTQNYSVTGEDKRDVVDSLISKMYM